LRLREPLLLNQNRNDVDREGSQEGERNCRTDGSSGERNGVEQIEAPEIGSETPEVNSDAGGCSKKGGEILTFCVSKGVTIPIRVKNLGGSVDSMHF
jgi:hypothetical protein